MSFTFTEYQHAEQPRVRFTGQVMQVYDERVGQIVEYHKTAQREVCRHKTAVPTRDALINRMDYEISQQGVDGWCDNVVVVQRVLTDQVDCFCWVEATSPLATIVIIALILAVSALIAFFLWIAYDIGKTVIEWVREDQQWNYRDPEGNVHTYDTLAELVTMLRNDYWLVCVKCGFAVASKGVYPTYGDIPQDVIDAFNEHIKNCAGIPGEEVPWTGIVIAVIGGVIVVGGLWALSKILGGRR